MSVRRKTETTEDLAPPEDTPAPARPAIMGPFLFAEVSLGLESLTIGLQNWRRMVDTAHRLIRMQQDAVLDIARMQCTGQYAARIPQPETVSALQDAAYAYERVGEAWLAAQRSTLESIAHPDVHH